VKTLFSTKAAKFWVAAIAAIIVAGLTAAEGVMADGITPQEWLTIIVALAGAASVYLVKNAEQ
jgi:hypothetical protein